MNTTSEDLKSLVATLRHALNVFAQEHTLHPDDSCSRLVNGLDYLLRSAVTHEGSALMPLAGAYWQEWHDSMEGAAGDAKEFREGAVELERRIGLELCAEFPPSWDGDDGDE